MPSPAKTAPETPRFDCLEGGGGGVGSVGGEDPHQKAQALENSMSNQRKKWERESTVVQPKGFESAPVIQKGASQRRTPQTKIKGEIPTCITKAV